MQTPTSTPIDQTVFEHFDTYWNSYDDGTDDLITERNQRLFDNIFDGELTREQLLRESFSDISNSLGGSNDEFFHNIWLQRIVEQAEQQKLAEEDKENNKNYINL